MNAFSVLAQIAGQSHLNKSTHKQTESELFSEVFRNKKNLGTTKSHANLRKNEQDHCVTITTV